MMKRINIFNLFMALAGLFVVSLSSCSKDALDKVNENPNNPTDVPARFALTDLITSTAFNVVGGDIPLYSSVYIEHEAGVWNQQYNAEIRQGEPSSATTYNNVWNTIYGNIKGLKIIIDKTSEGGEEEGNDITCGIAKVLLADNLGILTDYWGDVPYSESGVVDENGSPSILQPQVDQQSELYPQILDLLDEAITLLDGTDVNKVEGQDLIYGGDAGLWKKAAYGLKARYTMHTLSRSQDESSDLEDVLDFIDHSFSGPDEEMIFDEYDGGDQVNPLGGFSLSRDGLGASQSLLEKFQDLNDPRGEQGFMDYDFVQLSLSDALAGSVPNGSPTQQQFAYDISIAEYSLAAPTLLLSYHELKFLEAEALVRLGRESDAEAPLEDGVIAAFANLERTITAAESSLPLWGAAVELDHLDLSASVAEDYFDNEVSPRFATDALGTVMLQKYLAFWGASGESTEAYNDFRRLRALGEEDLIPLANPKNSDKFPLRFSYGSSDVLANPNVADAYGNGQYVYTDDVWWAGGDR